MTTVWFRSCFFQSRVSEWKASSMSKCFELLTCVVVGENTLGAHLHCHLSHWCTLNTQKTAPPLRGGLVSISQT